MQSSSEKNFTVGPSKLYHGVADFMSHLLHTEYTQVSHRGAAFTKSSRETIENFRVFFEVPADYKIFYTASSTETWDIIGRGLIDKKITHVTNGNFGEAWEKISTAIKKETQHITHADWKTRVELSEIIPDSDSEFLAMTGNETSSGIAYNPAEIAIIRAKYPGILMGIDITSSIGAVQYDFSQADVWHFSVQKGLGLPAGLGILLVGPRAWEKYEKRSTEKRDVGAHHRLGSMWKKMENSYQTPTTPNFLDICGLGFVCQQLKNDFGTSLALYEAVQQKAKFLRNFFEDQKDHFYNFGNSESIFVLETSRTTELVDFLASKNILISPGYGKMKNNQVRIANFAVHSMNDVEYLVETMNEFASAERL